MIENINLNSELIQSMKDWRHHLHANPELGFEEHQTAEFVSKRLKDWGLEVHHNVGITGVVGILKKGDSMRSIALRADMDALPIEELNELDYRSKNAGTMHAVVTMVIPRCYWAPQNIWRKCRF